MKVTYRSQKKKKKTCRKKKKGNFALTTVKLCHEPLIICRELPFPCNTRCRYSLQKIPRICSSHHGRIALPLLIDVGIAVVTDAAYHYAGESVHDSSCLHLETEYVIFLCVLVPKVCILDLAVARGNQPIMYDGGILVGSAVLSFSDPLLFANCAALVLIAGLRVDAVVFRVAAIRHIQDFWLGATFNLWMRVFGLVQHVVSLGTSVLLSKMGVALKYPVNLGTQVDTVLLVVAGELCNSVEYASRWRVQVPIYLKRPFLLTHTLVVLVNATGTVARNADDHVA